MNRAAQAIRRRPVPVLAGAAVVPAAGGAALWSVRRPPAFHPPAGVDALARELDRVIPASLREHRVPGATVAVVRDGEVRWSAAHGTADLGRRTPMRPDTGLQVASISKPVAGTGGHHGPFTQELRDGSRRFWHDGADPGFRARVEAYPERGWAVAVLTNGDNGNDVLGDVTRLLVR